jgi:homoserine acetyltransferase
MPKDPSVFGQDLPKDIFDRNTSELITLDMTVHEARPTYQPCRDIPVTYVVCNMDRCITPGSQRFFVEEAQKIVADKDDFTVIEMDCGHSPMLKEPQFISEIIVSTTKRARGVV